MLYFNRSKKPTPEFRVGTAHIHTVMSPTAELKVLYLNILKKLALKLSNAQTASTDDDTAFYNTFKTDFNVEKVSSYENMSDSEEAQNLCVNLRLAIREPFARNLLEIFLKPICKANEVRRDALTIKDKPTDKIEETVKNYVDLLNDSSFREMFPSFLYHNDFKKFEFDINHKTTIKNILDHPQIKEVLTLRRKGEDLCEGLKFFLVYSFLKVMFFEIIERGSDSQRAGALLKAILKAL
jgi:hypothetical protein